MSCRLPFGCGPPQIVKKPVAAPGVLESGFPGPPIIFDPPCASNLRKTCRQVAESVRLASIQARRRGFGSGVYGTSHSAAQVHVASFQVDSLPQDPEDFLKSPPGPICRPMETIREKLF